MNDLPPAAACSTDKESCSCHCLARLTNGVYYLAMGTWFGAITMLAVSAAATFQTVRRYEPSLHNPPWNQPELADKASSILSGAIVGSSLKGLMVIQIICAVIAIIAVIAQHTKFRSYLTRKMGGFHNLLRLLLLAIPVLVIVMDVFWITPSILVHRDAMWDMTQTQEVRNQAHTRFQTFHKLSERTVGFAAISLAGCVLLSSLVLGSEKRKPRDKD